MTGSSEYVEAALEKYPHLTVDGILIKPVTIDSFADQLKPYLHCF